MESEFEREGVAGERRPYTPSDYLVPGIIFAFAAVVIYLATQLDIAPPIIVGEAMQPRSFPIFLMVLIAILNAVLIWQLMSGERIPHPRQPPQTWVSMALMAVFFVLTEFVDMFVGLFVVMFIMALVWGERRLWLAALISIVTPLTIFLLFDLVLHIRFPRGILTELYYG